MVSGDLFEVRRDVAVCCVLWLNSEPRLPLGQPPTAAQQPRQVGHERRPSTSRPATTLLSPPPTPPPAKPTPPATAARGPSPNAPTVEISHLTFTYPGIDGRPPLIEDVCSSLDAGQRCLLVGSNGAGKTTILKILGGKHMVDPSMVRVLGRSAFHDTALTSSGDLCYLGGERFRRGLCRLPGGYTDGHIGGEDDLVSLVLIQRGEMSLSRFWILNLPGACTRCRMVAWVLLLDEITVDLDVLAKANLLKYLKKECEERGATIFYATHIFDGLDERPTHIVYIAHGNLQLALPLEKVKEMSQLSLMRTVEAWLRKERDEDRRRRKERKEKGLPEFDKVIDGSRVISDPTKSAATVVNNGWAAGRLTSTVAGDNSVLRQ